METTKKIWFNGKIIDWEAVKNQKIVHGQEKKYFSWLSYAK